ncbi:MAG: hypothetical protein AAFV96_02375 [Pseudomonadota bacterium]
MLTTSSFARRLGGVAIIGLLAAGFGGVATACPSNPGPSFPGALDLLEKEAPTGPTSSSNQAQIEIDGLTALGSSAGDSCAVAPMLPEGLIALAVSVVDSDTGKTVGFKDFRADSAARRGFCAGGRDCAAFVSTLEQDLDSGTPLKLVIDVASREPLDARGMAGTARRLMMASSVALGGVDQAGDPHHHLSIIRPRVVNVVTADAAERY